MPPPQESVTKIVKSPADFRCWILELRLPQREPKHRFQTLPVIFRLLSLSVSLFRSFNGKSLNDFHCALDDFWRNRHADLIGGLEIDGQIELCRLYQRKISRLCAFENLVDIFSRA